MDNTTPTEQQQIHEIDQPTHGQSPDIFNIVLEENQRLKASLASAEGKLLTLREKLSETARLVTLGTAGAGVAHELNNPLTVISAEADEILDSIQEGHFTVHQTRISAKNIKKCANRMRMLIDYIRQHARRDDSTPWTRLMVNDLIYESLLILKPQLSNAGIDLQLETTDDLPAIWGQAVQLGSVFENVISNAKDAFESVRDGRHKQITISTTLENEDHIRTTFEDNAGGMPEEIRARVFEPFFTTKKKGKGTGLGLALVADHIRAHRGELALESHEGVGTTITIRFPIERRTASEERHDQEIG